MDSTKNYKTKSDSKMISSIFVPLDIELLPDIIQKQLTTAESFVLKSNEIPISPTIEVIIKVIKIKIHHHFCS
jgi:hypothetical protein